MASMATLSARSVLNSPRVGLSLDDPDTGTRIFRDTVYCLPEEHVLLLLFPPANLP